MASALVKLNVVDFDLNPLYTILLHSSNINRVTEQDTFRSITYYDLLQEQFFIVSVSDSLNSILSQSGLIRINATNINGTDLPESTVMGVQEFNISKIDDVNTDGNDYRQITYVNKGGQIDIITVTDSLDDIQAQTIAAGGIIPSLAIIAPPAGTYVGNEVEITLSSNAIGASIYYTIDGSTPTTGSTLYTAPFTININRTIKAIAVLVGLPQGGVTEAAINVKCFTPVASPIGGLINSSTPITLTTATTGGTIRYTTDGTDPDSGDTAYTTTLFFSGDTTLKSRTFKTNQVDSDVRTSSYTVFVEIMLIGDTSGVAANGRLWRSFNFGGSWTQLQPAGNINVGWHATSAQIGGGFITGASDGRLFFSTDNGATWTEKFSPNVNTFDASIFGTAQSYSGQNLLIAGNEVDAGLPNIFISTDYGDNWSVLTVDGLTTSGGLTWVAAIEGNTIVTGRSVASSIRISKDGGTSWITPTGISNTLRSAWISEDENNIVALSDISAGSSSSLSLSTNGGTSFSGVTYPNASNRYRIIGASDGSRIYAFKTSVSISTALFAYSDNLGKTWTFVSTGFTNTATTITTGACSQDGRVVILADNNVVRVSTDYGQTFTGANPSSAGPWRGATVKVNPVYKVSAPYFEPTNLRVKAGDVVTVTTVTTGDTIRYTNDGSEPTSSSILYGGGIVITSDVTLKAKGFKTGSVDSDTTTKTYEVLLDTWSLSPSVGSGQMSYNRGVSYVSSSYSNSYNVVFALEGEECYTMINTQIQRSTDYGQTWVNETNRPAGGSSTWLNDTLIVSKDGTLSIAKANSSPENQGIWISGDVFRTAGTQVFPSGSTSTDFRPQNGCINENGSYAFVSLPSDGIYRSTNFGVTWAKVTTGTQTVNKSMCSDSGQYVYYANNSNQVYRSTDFGATFTLISGLTSNWVDCDATGQIVYCITASGLQKSTDYGASFSIVNAGVTTGVAKCDRSGLYCSYIASNIVWVSSDGGVNFVNRTPFAATWNRFNLGRN